MTVIQLPDDVYFAIFAYLELDDIPRLRIVSKKFLELTRAGSLWRRLLHRQVIQKNIPIPGTRGRSPDDFQGPELEHVVKRAHNFRLNWTSLNPIAKDVSTIPAIRRREGRIVSLQFLKRPGCQWLISLSVQGLGDLISLRTSTLECWDCSTLPNPTCIARREFRQVLSMAVNREESSERGIVAVQAPFITIYSIRPSPGDPDSGFVPIAMLPEKTDSIHVYASGGKMLTTATAAQQGGGGGDGRALLAWDCTKSPTISWELTNPRFPRVEQDSVVLAAVFNGSCVIVVKPKVCEVYALPENFSDGPGGVLEPIMQATWPWRVDSAVISPAIVAPGSSSSNLANHHRHSPITILVRFGSIFPWPINLLHQFEICLDTYFLGNRPIHEGNSPYQFPPRLRQTIGAPIRLFSLTDMALGPYGTAIWIDSHTEDHFGSHGQRLAARLTTTTVSREVGGDEGEEMEEEGEDASDQVATTMAASVMSWNEADSWIKLAMDEEEGKLALGHRNGDITLLSYI